MKKRIKMPVLAAFVLAVLVFAGCSSPSSGSGDCPQINNPGGTGGGNVSGMPDKGDFFGLIFDELKDTMTKFKDVEEALKSGSVVAGGPRLAGDSFYLTEYEGIYPTSAVWEGTGEHYMMITLAADSNPSLNLVMSIAERAESISEAGNLYYLSREKIAFTNGKCNVSWDDFTQLDLTAEDAEELTNPIKVDTVLGAGVIKNYVFKPNGWLNVENGVTLTVREGVTIRFEGSTGSGLHINAGARVIMEGKEGKPITLKGKTDNTPGSWRGMQIGSRDPLNKLHYVHILDASGSSNGSGALHLSEGKVAMTNCIIDNSVTNGITFYNGSVDNSHLAELTVFTGNTIRNCTLAPICTGYGNTRATAYNLRNLSNENPFHTWVNNGRNYIDIGDWQVNARMCIFRQT